MIVQNRTDPTATAFRMSSPSLIPAYFHHPRSNPKYPIVTSRVNIRTGKAERRTVRCGKVKSNRKSQVDTSEKQTSMIWKKAITALRCSRSRPGILVLSEVDIDIGLLPFSNL